MKRYSAIFAFLAGLALVSTFCRAQNSAPQRMELTGGGETIVLEPYAPNIIRVTLSMDPAPAKLFGDSGTGKFFRGSAPWAHIVVRTADGKQLLEMNGWDQAVYNHKD